MVDLPARLDRCTWPLDLTVEPDCWTWHVPQSMEIASSIEKLPGTYNDSFPLHPAIHPTEGLFVCKRRRRYQGLPLKWHRRTSGLLLECEAYFCFVVSPSIWLSCVAFSPNVCWYHELVVLSSRKCTCTCFTKAHFSCIVWYILFFHVILLFAFSFACQPDLCKRSLFC